MINVNELNVNEFYVLYDEEGESYEGYLKSIHNSSIGKSYDLIFDLTHETRYRDRKYRIMGNDRRKICINSNKIKEIIFTPKVD